MVEESSVVRIMFCITSLCCPISSGYGTITLAPLHHNETIIFSSFASILSAFSIIIYRKQRSFNHESSPLRHLGEILVFKPQWRTAKFSPLKEILEIVT